MVYDGGPMVATLAMAASTSSRREGLGRPGVVQFSSVLARSRFDLASRVPFTYLDHILKAFDALDPPRRAPPSQTASAGLTLFQPFVIRRTWRMLGATSTLLEVFASARTFVFVYTGSPSPRQFSPAILITGARHMGRAW